MIEIVDFSNEYIASDLDHIHISLNIAYDIEWEDRTCVNDQIYAQIMGWA